jgi:ADP-ribose pyrophosphatase
LKGIKRMRVYDGYLKIDKVDIPLKNGKSAMREIVKARDAVAVLCKIYGTEKYILVKQFRAPVGKYVFEVVAGCVEEGEDPKECAKREIQEETGYKPLSIVSFGEIYPSPGYSSEKITLYYSILDPERGNQNLDADEEVDVVELTAEEIFLMRDHGELMDVKTQLLVSRILG